VGTLAAAGCARGMCSQVFICTVKAWRCRFAGRLLPCGTAVVHSMFMLQLALRAAHLHVLVLRLYGGQHARVLEQQAAVPERLHRGQRARDARLHLRHMAMLVDQAPERQVAQSAKLDDAACLAAAPSGRTCPRSSDLVSKSNRMKLYTGPVSRCHVNSAPAAAASSPPPL